MKRCFLFFLMAGLAVPLFASTPSNALDEFLGKDLSKYAQWFSSAKLSASHTLELNATDDFIKSNDNDKKSTMTEVIKDWIEREGDEAFSSKPVVVVLTSRGGSLWTLDEKTDQAELVQPWDMIQPQRAGSSPISGRFFTYEGLGAETAFNGSGSLSGSLELGSYLYKDILDAGVNVQLTDMLNNSYTVDPVLGPLNYFIQDWTVAFGISSRVHFPLLPKIGLTGNVGAGVNLQIAGEVNSYSSTPVPNTLTITGDGLVGVSKTLNPSTSLDLTVQIQSYPVLLLGLTTFLSPPAASVSVSAPAEELTPTPTMTPKAEEVLPSPTNTPMPIFTYTSTPIVSPTFSPSPTYTFTAIPIYTTPSSTEHANNALPSLPPTPLAQIALPSPVNTPQAASLASKDYFQGYGYMAIAGGIDKPENNWNPAYTLGEGGEFSLGYQFDRRLSVQLDMEGFYFNGFYPTGKIYDIDTRVMPVIRYRFINGGISLYVLAGAGADFEFLLAPSPSFLTVGNFDAATGLGLEIQLAERGFIFVEGKYHFVFSPGVTGTDIPVLAGIGFGL